MKSYFIKMYFKGGVLVPFYLCCVMSIFFAIGIADSDNFKLSEIWHDEVLYEILKITFLSGLTGLCSLTIFLNSYKKIAESYLYSLLSFILLPYCFIAFVFSVIVEWSFPALAAVYAVLFFFHVIGPIISFQSFRATVLLNNGDSEIMNNEDDPEPMPNSDKKVQECDTTKA
jgi:hypothetical protein